MAVKVVDPMPDPEVVKRVTCGHCGARLEYVPIDVQEYHGRDYSGGPDGYKWIDCPNCGKRVVIDSW